MDLQLKDKVVLVKAGAKGIGMAITKTCAQEGAIAVAESQRDTLLARPFSAIWHTIRTPPRRLLTIISLGVRGHSEQRT
jgi:NAD(P)-dependent dehydrogenase (short-subunit alcohol dehydrogenase family)